MRKQIGYATGAIVYQSKNGALELKTKEHETIWLTQDQMAFYLMFRKQLFPSI